MKPLALLLTLPTARVKDGFEIYAGEQGFA